MIEDLPAMLYRLCISTTSPLPATVKAAIARKRLMALEKRRLSMHKRSHGAFRSQRLSANVKRKISENRLAALKRLSISRHRRQKTIAIIKHLLTDPLILNDIACFE